MKHLYALLSGVFFFITLQAQNQHSNQQTGSLGGCTVTATSVNASCNGLCDGTISAIANGVPPFSYIWSTGETLASISGLCGGNYTVIMTDSTGCADTLDIVITEPSAMSTTIFESYFNCQCTFIPFTTGGAFPYSYVWCNGDSVAILADCTPGLCTVTITDANGCTLQDSVLITPSPTMTLSPTVTDATCSVCSDGTVTANLTGGTPPITYNLVPGGGSNSTGIFAALDTGSYTLCATDSNFCTVCTTLVVNAPASSCSVTIIGVNSILCYGDCNGSMTAVGNGVPPFSFTWGNGDTTATIDSLCAGTYTVIMIDSVGCIDTAFATVTEPPPIISSYISDFSNCNCTYTETANGGTPPFVYQWCDGSTAPSMTNCTPGLCIVIITDANGCMVTDSIIINPPPVLSLTVQSTGTSCTGCNDGTVTAIASGGTPAYSYELIPGGTNLTGIFAGLAAGAYLACVTDSNDCVVCDSIFVEEDPTSITSLTSTESMRLYPNPFRNYLHVDISAELLIHHSAFILSDVTGRILLNTRLKHEHSILSIKDISPGIYFYQLIMDDKKEFNGRILSTD